MNPPFIRCRYCVAFEPYNLGNVYGRCRRKSPAPPKDADSETLWPPVSVTDGCCEGIMRPDPVEDTPMQLLGAVKGAK